MEGIKLDHENGNREKLFSSHSRKSSITHLKLPKPSSRYFIGIGTVAKDY
jgi:hypothetical protein